MRILKCVVRILSVYIYLIEYSRRHWFKMVIENKRKADESALVPANKRSKNEVALKNKNNSVLQAVSIS